MHGADLKKLAIQFYDFFICASSLEKGSGATFTTLRRPTSYTWQVRNPKDQGDRLRVFYPKIANAIPGETRAPPFFARPPGDKATFPARRQR